MPLYRLIIFSFPLLIGSVLAFAAEDARVLPAGVRRFQFRTVNAQLMDRRDENGKTQALGAPLSRQLSLDDLAGQSQGVEQSLLRGFMLSEGFDVTAQAGYFAAEVRGNVRAAVPSFAVGLNNRWTVGFGLPIYRARTSTKIGFVANDVVADLAAQLTQAGNVSGARQLVERINQAPDGLNLRLQAAGYEELGEWQGEGIGDLNFQAKFSHRQRSGYAFASKWSLIAPTGKVDDPNHLGDVEFGDGVWSMGYSAIGDLYINHELQWSSSIGAVMRGSDERSQRFRATKDEPIASKLLEAAVDMGDGLHADTSMQFLDQSGFFASAGLAGEKNYSNYWRSVQGDQFRIAGESFVVSEFVIGWNTTRKYLQGKSLLPGSIYLTIIDPVLARSAVTVSRAEVDCRVFF
jgi:hypothetical protein